MDITKALEKVDAHLMSHITEYNAAMQELDAYRGKELSAEDSKVVNQILFKIQNTFTKEIAPIINYIKKREEQAKTLERYYAGFIEDLVAAGAQDVSEAKS